MIPFDREPTSEFLADLIFPRFEPRAVTFCLTIALRVWTQPLGFVYYLTPLNAVDQPVSLWLIESKQKMRV